MGKRVTRSISSRSGAGRPARGRRFFGAGAALLVAGGGLIAGVPAASSAAASSGPTLTWGINASPRSLFGPTDFDSTMMDIMTLVQGTELTYSPTGKLEPELFSSWKAVNPTTYVYHVRSGVRFSNGDPMTAADVAYSMNLQMNQKLASQESYLYAGVKSVTAQGSTVTVRLSAPDSLWQYVPASIAGYVYEKKLVQKNLMNYGTPSVLPIGAGPYKVASYVPDSQVTLVPNPYYYGAKPHYSKIVFSVIPNAETMLLALQQGTIDGSDSASSPLSILKKDATVSLVPGDIWTGLTLDMNEAPFNNIHVREALYLATDRQAILGPQKDRTGHLASTVNDPSIFAASLPASAINASYKKILSFPYNIAEAKKQLKMSSVPNGFSTTLNVPEDDPTDLTTSQILKSDWAKIGVTLNLKLMPGGPRFQIILNHKKNLGIQIIGNAPDAPDPVEMAEEYFSVAQAAPGGNNSSNYTNPVVNQLLVKANAATNAATSSALTLQAQVLASKAVPIIPFSQGDFVVAVHKGWHIGQLGTFYSTTNWTNAIHAPK